MLIFHCYSWSLDCFYLMFQVIICIFDMAWMNTSGWPLFLIVSCDRPIFFDLLCQHPDESHFSDVDLLSMRVTIWRRLFDRVGIQWCHQTVRESVWFLSSLAQSWFDFSRGSKLRYSSLSSSSIRYHDDNGFNIAVGLTICQRPSSKTCKNMCTYLGWAFSIIHNTRE